jgi:RNA recognition motif. (a.k.a. RRM, RBD, or RNP domain)
MDSYLPLFINSKKSYNVYYRTHPNKSKTAIFVCCLDKALKKKKVKSWFKNCGKISSLEIGEMDKNSKKISYCILEFKHRQSLRRALDNTWLQEKIDENDQSTQMSSVNPEVENHVNKMEQDGFTIVLPKKRKVNKYDYIPPPLEYGTQ